MPRVGQKAARWVDWTAAGKVCHWVALMAGHLDERKAETLVDNSDDLKAERWAAQKAMQSVEQKVGHWAAQMAECWVERRAVQWVLHWVGPKVGDWAEKMVASRVGSRVDCSVAPKAHLKADD